jgi:hypothetical protein
MKKRRPLPHYTVEVEHNGKRHQGEYTVSGGVVTVTYYRATNSALNRGLHPEIEARQLLIEILEGGHWKF